MTVLEFDRDFVEYENRLRKEKNMALKSMKPGYKAKETAKGFFFAMLCCAAVFGLIVCSWIFA